MTRRSRLIHETPKNKNDTVFADSGGMRSTEYLHPLAKTRSRPAFSSTAKEQSGDDSSKERERDRLWNHWLQREEGRALSCFSKIAKTICEQARHWDRLGTGSRVGWGEPRCEKDRVALSRTCEPANQRSATDNAYAISSRWPGQRAFAKKMYMQMGNTFTRIWPAIDDHAITVR